MINSYLFVWLTPVFTAFCLWNTTVLTADHAVTYGHIHGRFGDALVAYMRAKWVSHYCQLPLLYKPFPYSDQLVMHVAEQSYDLQRSSFEKHVFIENSAMIEAFSEIEATNTLFELPYFSENFLEYLDLDYFQRCSWFQIDWEDPMFRAVLRSYISPIEPMAFDTLPEDSLTVAIHVRLGGSFENLNDVAAIWPLKFPPLAWYCEQLAYLSQIYRHPKMYIYIFTDDENPERLAEYFQQRLQAEHMHFDCRRKGNSCDANVVEDLFSMTRFECLIRPASNFSFVAGVIGQAKTIISPESYRRLGGSCYINARKVVHRPYDTYRRKAS